MTLKCKTNRKLLVLILFVLSTLMNGCGGDDEPVVAFTVDFNSTFIDENNVRFSNASEGDYKILSWDFGNGQTETTTVKSQTYDVYYPEAGDYDVKLTVVGFEGEKESVTKKITITRTDFSISFTAEVDPTNPNQVNLKNTSIGETYSFVWKYRNREVENENNVVAYFPYAGNYFIELIVEKNGKSYSLIQSVTISSDDPDYFSSLQLAWSDEFDGDAVNLDNWTFETGAGGWGNNELQNYTDGNNAKVQDGILTITAEKLNEDKVAGSYTSSRMISNGKKEFTYGRMEIRAKLPSGTGIWPAIWMLGTNIGSAGWPACGEIDIMEYVGYLPNTVHATVHTNSGSGSNGNGSSKTLQTAEEEFHVYGLFWTEKEMIFYTDAITNITHRYAPSTKTDDNWPFYKPQFFILNVAVGGNWGGAHGIDNSIFPQSMLIDYVRVYQEP